MGLVQNDIKRVLAYSTISQLGYMFLACGAGAFAAGIFHLSTHAYFKALLFLGSGAVIHALAGEQDIRKMGGLWSKLPVTGKTFVIGALAIAGIPPLAGFFSKDEILWRTFASDLGSLRWLLWGVGLLTALLTAFYMFRLVGKTFFGASRVPHEVAHHIHEAPRSMTVPLIVLAVLSVVGGWIGLPTVWGGSRFEHFLAPVFRPPVELAVLEHSHQLEYVLMVGSVLVGVFGIWLAVQFYLKHGEIPEQVAVRFPRLYRLVYNKYYVDEAYSAIFVEGPVLGKAMGTGLARFDLRVIDGYGVDGTGWFTRMLSRLSIWWDTWIVDGAVNLLAWMVWVLNWPARVLQTGQVQGYALLMASGVVVFFLYYVARYILHW
jgi:NADH-quinone oxidoreductase subunit L